jgi:hypothetical protein
VSSSRLGGHQESSISKKVLEGLIPRLAIVMLAPKTAVNARHNKSREKY